jgi:hypothetical protein
MSASEKLKALESRMSDLDNWFPDGIAAQQAYLVALPQIVAVVEAAEKQNGWLPTSDVSRALSALEEALS